MDEARQRILNLLPPLTERETVGLYDSLGRITAHAVRAPRDVPPFDNSAMDGYALRGADIPAEGQRELRIVGTVLAGKPYDRLVDAGACVRIMTGGVLPEGTDSVIMQEDVIRLDDIAVVGAGHKTGNHVRHAGEDIAQHDLVISAGKRLGPADLGVLASLGFTHCEVVRRPRVAYFSTGDELRPVGEPLSTGCLYDSSRYTLYGLLHQLGVMPIDLGIVPDQRQALRDTLLRAAAEADVIISTGGVSVGEADFVRDTLGAVGEIHFWRVGMKPGRPFAFGRIEQAWFFGLPGNPVSTMVTFLQFVQPALRHLMGEQRAHGHRLRVPCITTLKKAPGRMEFQRGILESTADGHAVVRSTGAQGSAILSSMSKANCFIVLPAECGDLPAGSLVEIQVFTLL
ncbi:MAG: gephyrin-like molybdotransferase Glp [Pseudomonadota bacterium]